MTKNKTQKIKSVPDAKKTCWKAFSKYIRIRDCIRTMKSLEYGKCISCGRVYPINKLQAGHFVPGRHNANLFYEKGCHIQCMGCNIYKYGNVLNYMDGLIKLYGKKIVAEIRDNDKTTFKFTVEILEEKRKFYIEETKKLTQSYRLHK